MTIAYYVSTHVRVNQGLIHTKYQIPNTYPGREKGKPAITTPTTSVKAFININMVVINNQKLSQIITVAAPGPWSKLKL